MENSNTEKGVMFFGRDLSKIPCFRNTFLYGIGGGIAVGLTTFMCTSRPQLSSHFAVASYTIICMSYWVHCRYHFSKTKFELAQIKSGMQQHVMHEGTELEKEILKGGAKTV